MASLEDISRLVIKGKMKKTQEMAKTLLEEGFKPLEIINNGLIAGMNEVGVRFKNNDVFVPEVLLSAKAMSSGLEVLKPLLEAGEMKSEGVVVLGTVKGDLHDIGKNLVGIMLESSGFTIIDAGIDVSPESFISIIKEKNVEVLAMSALLTTTMLHMKDAIELLKEEGLRDKVKVIIGGAPVSQDFADEISADGFSPDAASAVELCKRLLA